MGQGSLIGEALPEPGCQIRGVAGAVSRHDPAQVVVPVVLQGLFFWRRWRPVGLKFAALVEITLGVQNGVVWERRAW